MRKEKMKNVKGLALLLAGVMIAAAVRFSPERSGAEANSEAAPLPVLSLRSTAGSSLRAAGRKNLFESLSLMPYNKSGFISAVYCV